MPLFKFEKDKVVQVAQADFGAEKALQSLVENNLGPIFSCRLVASEHATGALHAGRIDTLALSEDDNPVIIEYKKVVSSDLVNQSLFYLSWLADHHGDFEIACQKALGPKVAIDWSAIRVICIAPSYKKYDLHAVQMMGRSIELWTYRRFANDTFYLEQIQQSGDAVEASPGKRGAASGATKKGSKFQSEPAWTTERALEGKPAGIRELFGIVREYMLSLDMAIEEAPQKMYIAYRTTKNILCVEVQKKKLLLYLRLDPKKYIGPAGHSRDVSRIGHWGTGDLEISVATVQHLESAKQFMRLAYEQIGG